VVWASVPSLVSAGLFGFASAQGSDAPRSESLQTLPILQSQMSPMLLTNVGGPDPITDGDSMAAPFLIYGDAEIVVPTSDTISTYVVQSGDTLSEIADRYQVSVNTIRWANNIPTKGTVSVGQKLVVLPISGVRYKVIKGDTIAGIAKKFKGDTEDIASYNGLESSADLKIGMDIIIPDGEMSIPTAQIKTSTKSGVSVKIPAAPAGKAVASGYFSKPVANGILTQGYHDHYHALDISLPRGISMGAPILAAASGTVIVANGTGWNGGYGSLVIIQHDNGMQTLYAHLSRVDVAVGATVSKGQKIGGMGSTGRSTGPHLHWEVRGGTTPMLYSK